MQLLCCFLHHSAEYGERKSSHGAHPEPNLCEEEMEIRAIDHAVDFISCNSLCTKIVAVAKQGDKLLAHLYNAMHDKRISCICHHHIVFANIALIDWSKCDCRATAEEGQHTLTIYRYAHSGAFEQRVTHDCEEFSVGYGATVRHRLFVEECRVRQLGCRSIWQTLQVIDRSTRYNLRHGVADVVLQGVVVGECRWARRQNCADSGECRQTVNLVVRSLRKAYQATHRHALIHIARCLSAPRRAIDTALAVNHSDYRAIVVEQLCALDILTPQTGVGALSCARLAKTQDSLVLLDCNR